MLALPAPVKGVFVVGNSPFEGKREPSQQRSDSPDPVVGLATVQT